MGKAHKRFAGNKTGANRAADRSDRVLERNSYNVFSIRPPD